MALFSCLWLSKHDFHGTADSTQVSKRLCLFFITKGGFPKTHHNVIQSLTCLSKQNERECISSVLHAQSVQCCARKQQRQKKMGCRVGSHSSPS